MPEWYQTHAILRTDCYVLLAALLTAPPSAALITLVRNLRWDEGVSPGMHTAFAALSHAGNVCPMTSISEEFHRLFVGLGSGELVPYGSWYREKMIQSAPLAAIRSDLAELGIVRQSGCHETEDHAGALCEIMALLSLPENAIPEDEQALFFDHHVASWMPEFFKDLQATKDIVFYRAVGEIGCCFLEGENTYLHLSKHVCLSNTRTGCN
jgi:TorA maturation chaperone TorD